MRTISTNFFKKFWCKSFNWKSIDNFIDQFEVSCRLNGIDSSVLSFNVKFILHFKFEIDIEWERINYVNEISVRDFSILFFKTDFFISSNLVLRFRFKFSFFIWGLFQKILKKPEDRFENNFLTCIQWQFRVCNLYVPGQCCDRVLERDRERFHDHDR